MKKKNIPFEFVYQLFALIIAIIIVHAFYVSVIRPNAAQIIEEQNGRGLVTATYTYGAYIDEALNIQGDGKNFYYHADDLYSTVKITDATGGVAEEYQYEDYGKPLLFDSSGSRIAGGRFRDCPLVSR